MKALIEKYKYYFILALIISVSFIIGILAGSIFSSAKTEKPVYVQQSKPTVHYYEPDKRTSLGEFMLTGYCICSECCGDYSDGYTATMTKATPGRTIAVDPEVIPYGTIVEINGEEYVAEDCGGAIKGNHIDILCASHELASAYGVKYAEIYIIEQ